MCHLAWDQISRKSDPVPIHNDRSTTERFIIYRVSDSIFSILCWLAISNSNSAFSLLCFQLHSTPSLSRLYSTILFSLSFSLSFSFHPLKSSTFIYHNTHTTFPASVLYSLCSCYSCHLVWRNKGTPQAPFWPTWEQNCLCMSLSLPAVPEEGSKGTRRPPPPPREQ